MSAKKLPVLIFSLGLFIVFVYFSFLVGKETFVQFDFDTTVKIQDRLPRKVDLPFSTLSLIGSAEVTGIIWLALVILALLKKYWLTFFSMSSFVLATAIEVFGKVFVFHPGPPFLFYRGVIDFSFPSSYAHTSYSYPSGHLTRTSFLVAFLLTAIYLKASPLKGFIPAASLAVFLGLMFVSRIYLGEHWASDVIGGLLLGGSLGTLTALTIPLRKKSEQSSEVSYSQ